MGCSSRRGISGMISCLLKAGCSSIAGMLDAMLLLSPSTVDGGGDGRSGMATVRLGGDCAVVAILLRSRESTIVDGAGEGRRGIATVRIGGDCEVRGGGVRAAVVSETAADNSLANAEVKPE
jgi:hypothetical protein